MMKVYHSVLKKSRAVRDKVLQSFGLRDVKNVFWGLAYTDVYRALAWDRLHAYHGGLFSDHLLEQFLEILNAKGVPRKFRDEFEKQLDAFPRWRDLNHFKEIAQFREFTDGRKYEDLSKIIIFAIHNVLMDPEMHSDRAYQLLRLTRRYLELDMFASLRNHNEATLTLGRKALLDWDKELKRYQRLHPAKDWNFPKAHTHKHLVDEIKRKGATRNSNTKTFEAMHPSLKKDFKRTNFVNVNPQLARFDARDYSSFLIQQQMDRAAARDEAMKSISTQDGKEPEGHQVKISLQPAQVTDGPAIPTHLTAGSGIRSLIKDLSTHLPSHFQDAFKDIDKKISARLSQDLGRPVKVDRKDVVTIYRYVKVDYVSYEDATVATDYLRMNASFHSRERFDCGLFSVYGHSFVFAQMVAVLGVELDGVEYLVAVILPYDEKLTGSTREKQQRDRDLMFHRLRARPRKADSAVVLARTLVRGALLVPDFAEKWPGDEYLVMDVVDADMWLRMKDIRGRAIMHEDGTVFSCNEISLLLHFASSLLSLSHSLSRHRQTSTASNQRLSSAGLPTLRRPATPLLTPPGENNSKPSPSLRIKEARSLTVAGILDPTGKPPPQAPNPRRGVINSTQALLAPMIHHVITLLSPSYHHHCPTRMLVALKSAVPRSDKFTVGLRHGMIRFALFNFPLFSHPITCPPFSYSPTSTSDAEMTTTTTMPPSTTAHATQSLVNSERLMAATPRSEVQRMSES
ncbi:hypothetical protein NMY22_g4276 [Coprinellus aureogranulatus]|nr:hypothetical protein NMY22_g4276 [Coprinellus aureogranulatus]